MSSYSKPPLRVGIVDDSPLIRKMIETVIHETEGLEIAGMAADPYDARKMIKDTNPDVITLDVEMPRMNGIAFLKKIMTLRPMPVIMVSTLTQKGTHITLEALEIGAIDYIAKPVKGSTGQNLLGVFRTELVPKLKALKPSGTHGDMHTVLPVNTSHAPPRGRNKHYDLIGIASSTGGIERLRYLISHIAVNLPPILIVQHINKMYIPSMVERMQTIAPPHIRIKAAHHHDKIENNTLYFADNRTHLTVVEKSVHRHIALLDAPPRNGFVASADYMFESMASLSSGRHLGLVLSGMGNDGAEGLRALKQSGAMTMGEDEHSCLVYGMPRAASQMGALHKQISIERIASVLNGDGV